MKDEIFDLLYLSSLFLALFVVAEILYHFFKVKVELTRKFVHVGTGLLTMLFPYELDSIWSVLFICICFLIILSLTLRFNLLQSVNAIDRKSVGSLAFPIAVLLSFWAFTYTNKQYIFFYTPILILSFCDTIAALSGKAFPYGKYRIGSTTKTLVGSTMFFLSAFVVFTLIGMYLNEPFTNTFYLRGLLVAASTTIAEALSGKGFDNIAIPIAAIVALMLS